MWIKDSRKGYIPLLQRTLTMTRNLWKSLGSWRTSTFSRALASQNTTLVETWKCLVKNGNGKVCLQHFLPRHISKTWSRSLKQCLKVNSTGLTSPWNNLLSWIGSVEGFTWTGKLARIMFQGDTKTSTILMSIIEPWCFGLDIDQNIPSAVAMSLETTSIALFVGFYFMFEDARCGTSNAGKSLIGEQFGRQWSVEWLIWRYFPWTSWSNAFVQSLNQFDLRARYRKHFEKEIVDYRRYNILSLTIQDPFKVSWDLCWRCR